MSPDSRIKTKRSKNGCNMRPCIFLHAKMCNGKFAHTYMQTCSGDETSAERQSSLALFFVEEEKRCTTVYFFSVRLCVLISTDVCAIHVCPNVFVWRNCVREQLFCVQTHICMRIPLVCPTSLYWHLLHTCSKIHASDVFMETGHKTSHDDGSEALSALLRTA